MRKFVQTLGASLGLAALAGCSPANPVQEAAPRDAAAAQDTAETGSQAAWTEERVHGELRETNPSYNGGAAFRLEGGKVAVIQLTGSGVTNLAALSGMGLKALDARQCRIGDLSPLKGLALTELYLEETDVADLAPLRGMPLEKLYLSLTRVDNLQPLAGAPLTELNLLGTQITDLSPLRGMPLQMLWLNETPISDLSPLAGCPLVSLTLHRTLVEDLSPLAGTSLQRLHVAETPVSDLTPLRGLRLTRLVLTPERIRAGWEGVREMTSLREMGTVLEELMPPQVFFASHGLAAGQ